MTNAMEAGSLLHRGIVGRIALRERMSNQVGRDPVRRPARVAQVLTYAHRIQRAIERGEYRDCSEVAERLGYTKARITQILNLVLMDPGIQEDILHLESVDGLEPMGEHAIRVVADERDWVAQRARWESVAAHHQRRHLAF